MTEAELERCRIRVFEENLAAGPAAAPAQLTALQKFAGLITFMNVLWVLGIVLGVACFAFLFGRFVVTVLVHVPLVFYEFLFYAGSLALLFCGRSLSPDTAPYVGLTGALLFGAALAFTAKAHKGLNLGPALASAILCLVWSAGAIAYSSSMLGLIAIAALMSAFGFSALVTPLCYGFGFKDDAAVGRATTAAFAVLAVYVAARIVGKGAYPVGMFESGGLFLGSFVGYLGLLIASSRWYGSKKSYVLFQIVTIAAGIAALLVGSVFGIGELQKIGGTFFVLYGIEKICEIPAKSKTGYAAIGLVASLAVFAFCWYVKSNPESLRPYVFMPR